MQRLWDMRLRALQQFTYGSLLFRSCITETIVFDGQGYRTVVRVINCFIYSRDPHAQITDGTLIG